MKIIRNQKEGFNEIRESVVVIASNNFSAHRLGEISLVWRAAIIDVLICTIAAGDYCFK